MDYCSEEFGQLISSLPTLPRLEPLRHEQSLSFEEGQVADTSSELFNRELCGPNGEFILPTSSSADFSNNTPEATAGLYNPFFAPIPDCNLELSFFQGGMDSPQHENNFNAFSLGPSTTSFEPLGLTFATLDTFPDFRQSAVSPTSMAVHSPLAPSSSSSSSSSTTPGPETPTNGSGAEVPQLYEAEAQFPILLQTNFVKPEEPAPAIDDKYELPRLPTVAARSDSVPTASRSSPGSTTTSIRRSSRITTAPLQNSRKPSSGKARHACTVPGCDATFSDTRGRNRHIRSKHENIKFFCPGMCLKDGFCRDDALNRHLRTVDEDSKCQREARKWGWRPYTADTVKKLLKFKPPSASA